MTSRVALDNTPQFVYHKRDPHQNGRGDEMTAVGTSSSYKHVVPGSFATPGGGGGRLGARRARKLQLHASREAERADALPTMSYVAENDPAPIELFPEACRLGTDEIECMYCTRTIPAGAAHRTCPVCATKWRKEFGVRWFEERFHVESIEVHQAFTAGERGVRGLNESDVSEEHAIEGIPAELVGVRAENHEAFLLVRALRVDEGLGARAIRDQLRLVNAMRVGSGKRPIALPGVSTISYWLNKVDRNGGSRLFTKTNTEVLN